MDGSACHRIPKSDQRKFRNRRSSLRKVQLHRVRCRRHQQTCWEEGCNECQLHSCECICSRCVAREVYFETLFAKARADQREAEVEAEHQRSLAGIRADEWARRTAEEEELDRQQFRRAEAEREEDYSRNTTRELAQESADVTRAELETRRGWNARSNGKLTDATNADNADAPEGLTLDALAAVFDDEVDLTPVPAVLEREDGALVLPSGKLNWIYGLPGTGKSFLCEIDLIMAVMRGGRALYLDYEDSAKTFHQRAAMLGFNLKDYADCFKYIHGGLSDYPMAQTEAMAWLLEAPNPGMNQVIIDAAESSGCPSDGAPINDWLEKVVLPWRSPSVNSGVLVNDHIPKTKDNRPDGPIGSQRKMAAVDGISILVGGYCWSKTKSGRITLINDKDRTGQFGKKDPVATIIGTWEGEGESRGFSYRITESTKEDSANANIGGELLTAVAEAGPLGMVGKNNLAKCVGGNRNIVFQTIDALVEGGMLATKKAGQTITYMLTEEGLEYVD